MTKKNKVSQTSSQTMTKQSQLCGIVCSVNRTLNVDDKGITRCSCGGYIWKIKYPDGNIRMVCGDCGYDQF